jgi:conjugal transfer pilus assembly protein TraB
MFKNLTTKQRQRIFLLAVVALFIAIIIFASYITQRKGEERVKEGRARTSKKMTLLTDKVEKDLWVAAEGQNIKALEKSNEEMRTRVDQLTKEVEEAKKELKKKEPVAVKMPPVPPPKPGLEKPKPERTKQEPKAEETRSGEPVLFPPEETPPFTSSSDKKKPPSLKLERVEKRMESPGSSIRVFKDETLKEKKEETEKKKKTEEETTWLPSGSFMKVVVLSGIDAPTSGQGQSEPYPVLLGVTDLSVLPNRFKMNLKDCFIIGAGYGNLPDERAYVRTETLSCVRNDGMAIDVALKGHVVGEDGKLGMRGRLVSKQGQKLALALISGLFSSFGYAFRPQSATVLQLTPSGETEQAGLFRYGFGDILEAGALGGVGGALNRLSNYYLQMANKVFPIIEIDAGREVEVLVLKGQELKIAEKKKGSLSGGRK